MADKASLLNRVETVSIDTDTVQIFLNATVYNASYKHQLTIHIRGVPIASVDNISWSTGTAQRIITLSNDKKEAIQKYMFEDKSVTATFVLATSKVQLLSTLHQRLRQYGQRRQIPHRCFLNSPVLTATAPLQP